MDFALTLDANGADISFDQGDVVLDPGLESAILVSLFSDGRREEEDPPVDPADPDDRRGYWPDTPSDRFDSLLWLIYREKNTSELERRAQDYASRALEWLVRDGVCERVTVEASRPQTHVLALSIHLERGSARQYQAQWDHLESTTFEAFGVAVRLLTH